MDRTIRARRIGLAVGIFLIVIGGGGALVIWLFSPSEAPVTSVNKRELAVAAALDPNVTGPLTDVVYFCDPLKEDAVSKGACNRFEENVEVLTDYAEAANDAGSAPTSSPVLRGCSSLNTPAGTPMLLLLLENDSPKARQTITMICAAEVRARELHENRSALAPN
jgi:hypothetical protein